MDQELTLYLDEELKNCLHKYLDNNDITLEEFKITLEDMIEEILIYDNKRKLQ